MIYLYTNVHLGIIFSSLVVQILSFFFPVFFFLGSYENKLVCVGKVIVIFTSFIK